MGERLDQAITKTQLAIDASFSGRRIPAQIISGEDRRDAIAVALADTFLCQPKEMPWEERIEQLTDAAIRAGA